MKVKTLVLLLLCVSTAAFAALLPKVAVLDAVLPQGMDPNIAIGVTEKISEELWASGKYMVLDRTTVGQSLKEIEFQMSGLVSDADIKKAGEQLNTRLGATYVVVARVALIDKAYFVTAKLIDIKTGEINAQASYDAEGGPAVTLTIAQVVGKKLAVGAKEVTQLPEEPATTTTPPPQTTTTTPQVKPQETTTTAAAKRKLKSHIVGAYQLTGLSGEVADYSNSSISSIGLNVHWLQSLGGLYLLAIVDYTSSSNSIGAYGTTFGIDAGGGWGFPLFKAMQAYIGAFIGYSMFTFSENWYNVANETFGGISFGAEIGLDWILLNFLSLDLRISYTGWSMSGLDGDAVGYVGTSFGVGIAY